MSVALPDALKDVDLNTGTTYKVQVGDKWVVMHVLSSEEYHSATDWFLGKVMPPDAIYNSMKPFVVTEDDLTPGYLSDDLI